MEMQSQQKNVMIESDGTSVLLSYNYLDYDQTGYLHAMYNVDNLHILRNNKVYGYPKILLVGVLHVVPEARGKGIGSILLQELIQYAKLNNVKKIILDDMTDHYRQPHNIYVKHEFKYIGDFGPEMELLIK